MRGSFKAFSLLCTALFSNMAFAQAPGRLAPGTGIITGTIQIEGEGTKAGVRVAVIAVEDTTGANLLSLSETDASGHFRLTDIPQGRYYVVAGRVSSFTWFPGGVDRTAAKEVVVEPARTVANINFKVPADSRRPPPLQATNAKSAPEFEAYQRASNERSVATRISLLLNFEKNFPQSQMLSSAYEDLMDLYISKGDASSAMKYGDKVMEMQPDNVRVLVKVSQAYGLAQINLREARRVAEKAVTSAARLKTLSYSARPEEYRGYSAVQWTGVVSELNASAKNNLEWVNQVIVWNQKTLNAALRSRH